MNVKERYGFKFAHGDVLQMIGRVPNNDPRRYMDLNREGMRLRVVSMTLDVCPEGCVQRQYLVRGVSEAGHFVGNPANAKAGLYAINESELEPFVPDATVEEKATGATA